MGSDAPMRLQVFSEIGPLRRVLVHTPGREIDRMSPSMMEHLLFDDILYGDQARHEHAIFRRVLEAGGAEVLDAQDLAAAALGSEEARRRTLDDLAGEWGVPRRVVDRLRELEPAHLAEALIAGIRPGEDPSTGGPRTGFDLAPVPNYFFQRDPQAVLGDRVVISSMATDARERETLLASLIFRDHPLLGAACADRFEIDAPPQASANPDRVYPYPHLEGGDVLVADAETILVGISERTNRGGVEVLASYLRREETSFRHLIVVELPHRRSYMHLDTVFTFIDRGLCLGYVPVIDPPPGAPALQWAYVHHVDLTAHEVSYQVRRSLRHALDEVGLEVEIVPCGGTDPLEQEREQWTDGANAFAVAPGVILLYRRNHRTVDALSRRGWRILGEEEVASGEAELLGHGPTVVTLQGNELSRARGGPRCMTMPLVREPL